MGIFDDIDFNHLPEHFKEDSVREEIITPILKCLGYSAFDPSYRIIRSPHLAHPFTQFGTNHGRKLLIPDYLIQVKGENAFIMEAKSPSENITAGKNVEQAYSYAINREVRAKRFVLCNGREMSIFDVNGSDPLLHFSFAMASEDLWGRVYELLSPAAFENPHIFNFKPDYGIWCIRNGFTGDDIQYFYSCYILDVYRLDDNTFTFTAAVEREEELLASFDFDISLFEKFMEQVPGHLKNIVRSCVRKSPFKYIAETGQDSFPLSFSSCLSEAVQINENEHYLPLRVIEFLERE
ncbi:MAG: type I restriction enzyme HsdR N-terminal domain-containing protein [Clostridium sp.]|nr:type I restriction enzyme HsdR N-terminal domain-containing protein [Clostridium sp.]